jgi:D-alanyl-D-alanine carboxypeptidase (penicillin-binding protein 5/6)
MSRAALALLAAAAALGGCSLGDDSSPAPAPAVRQQLPPAPPSSPASVALEGDDSFDVRFKLRPPRAAIVFDLATGDVLWRRRPLERLPIASLTKVMTALVVATTTNPRDRVLIHADALRYTGPRDFSFGRRSAT